MIPLHQAETPATYRVISTIASPEQSVAQHAGGIKFLNGRNWPRLWYTSCPLTGSVLRGQSDGSGFDNRPTPTMFCTL